MPEPLRFLSPIHKASRQIGIHLTARVEATGLQGPEAHLILFLASYAPCPIGEIRRVLGPKRSTLTSMLDRLESRGLIRRVPCPEDRRSFLVELTGPGGEMADLVRRPVEELEDRIRRDIDEEDLRGFDRVMTAIARVTGVHVRNGR
jgi:DNA-binding MarR family transcriptional regulator